VAAAPPTSPVHRPEGRQLAVLRTGAGRARDAGRVLDAVCAAAERTAGAPAAPAGVSRPG
jgi:hypothetical protein